MIIADQKYQSLKEFEIYLKVQMEDIKLSLRNQELERRKSDADNKRSLAEFDKKKRQLKSKFDDQNRANLDYQQKIVEKLSGQVKTRAGVTTQILEDKIAPMLQLPQVVNVKKLKFSFREFIYF